MIDLDRPCPHEQFQADVSVVRLKVNETDTEIAGYSAEITIYCEDCDEHFRFTGLPKGFSMSHPTSSLDETTLMAPIRPASADDDFGLGLPGFSVRVNGEDL